MKEDISGIYKITNTINGKIYIGCSKEIEKRWKAHITKKRPGVGKAIQKYGKENFTFEVILQCPNMCFSYWEKYYIAKYNCISPKGYNLSVGGEFTLPSRKARQNITTALIGRKLSDETKRKISMNSKKLKHSEKTKKLMSEQRKGNKRPMEQNGRAQKIKYNGKIYGCKKELYLELGISIHKFRVGFSQGLYGIEIEK